jgi:hypothetical protein
MQPRTLAQIVAELNPTFQAQTQSLQQQQQLIPQEIASQESALNAQKDVAYEDIVSGARRRGLGFSGIPLGEQAKYAATQYAPALAGLRQQGQQKAMSLQDAILAINERRDTLGQQIYQTEQDRSFQANEAEKNRQASLASARASAINPIPFSSPNQSTQSQNGSAVPRAVQKSPGNFAFYDAQNRPITAAQYAQATQTDIRDVLYDLGQGGDQQAAKFYNLLRGINSEEGVNSTIAQIAKTAPQIFGGYVLPESFRNNRAVVDYQTQQSGLRY